MVMYIKKLAFWRMLQWLVAATALYFVALLIAWPPQVQTGLLAAANCALAAWVGYWIDHAVFVNLDKRGYQNESRASARLLCKGLIISFAMLACNIKLG